ncbi:50S ribosomal protein L4 [Candidatus Pacearchaeota archaeon CG_4_10_14_0_2_um_filter_05_32_18]|nr:MAG: 50S ribosomal protein L4 [Candidatus Pacearchaeota archaeon CG1_02_32_21]PIZ83522.1 MAG: 50S ribosomal protein L4 [Candidatus Pacearchaeota archaeon CG_4_10_14_0_2_um_filter_05_32_18]
MKSQIISIEGKKIKDIELPKVFSSKIREDILKKTFESEQIAHPYGPSFVAGRQHSASGIIRHIRHKWKSGYGRGMSRIPRKIHWRRGTQFYWIGAEVSGTRGGRRAHGPRPEGTVQIRKINKKERKLAIFSAIAATASSDKVIGRYNRIDEIKEVALPVIVESKISELKTKELINALDKILGKLSIQKEKNYRSGKGKLRNRKYKNSRGLIIITGNDEKIKTDMIESVRVKGLMVSDLYPSGRIAVYTEKAIKDLENIDKVNAGVKEK